MKLQSIIMLVILSLIVACDKEEPNNHSTEINFDYTAMIMSPNVEDKHVGDSIHVHIVFASTTNETIHHIGVSLKDKLDPTQEVISIANHVHESDGEYEFHMDFALSEENGVTAHTDWLLEAKVWGHEAGDQEVIETLEFHVHP